MKSMHWIGAWCFLLPLLLSELARADVAYTLTDLGPIGGQPRQFDRVLTGSLAGAQAIDNSGRVTGNYIPAGASMAHGFIWANGTRTDIGFLGNDPASQSTTVYHMDSVGNIYGYSYTDSATTHLFAYRNGVMSDIDPQLNDVAFWGNNKNPTLVGETLGTITNPVSHAIIYQNGILTDLGTLGGANSEAFGINDSGEVVGRSNPSATTPLHAFAYSNGVMKDLGVLSSNSHAMSEAFFVNASGQVAGESSVSPSLQFHAFLYSGGQMVDLGQLGTKVGLESDVLGLNNLGEVVGWSFTDSGSTDAFVYRGGAMMDLNSLIDPSLGWQLQLANGINDLGQIVGLGIAPTGQFDSYLLTPVATVPEPSAPVCAITAFLSLLVRRSSRDKRG